MTAFEELGTEARDPAGADLDLRSTIELVELMNAADATIPGAVAAAAAAVAGLVDDIAARITRGGRLVYAGAGTSGRLAALDAVECEPTYSVAVIALVAPDDEAEDDRNGGMNAVSRLGATEADVVVGISASGRSPWVVGALEAAHAKGALTACVVCVEGSELAALADREVCVPVGAEVVAGSTRLKAGTAQKLVLNMHLDDLDDPARPDPREPDGRRRAAEREAPRPPALASSPRRRGCPRRRRPTRWPRRTATQRTRSPRSPRRSARRGRGSASAPRSSRDGSCPATSRSSTAG